MKISKTELIETLDNLYDPYPAFTNKLEKQQFLTKLKREILSESEFRSLSQTEIIDNIYDDIRDDIQNCGRDPLAKFIEMAKFLYYLKLTSYIDFDTTIQYIADSIEYYS